MTSKIERSYDFHVVNGSVIATDDRYRVLQLMESGYRPLTVPQMFGTSDGYYVLLNDGTPSRCTLTEYEQAMLNHC